jgi:hypothetical protein
MNVALLIICTGKYKTFLYNLITTADKYFLINHNVTYYLYVDEYLNIDYSNRNIKQIIIPNEPFPLPTLYRYKYINSNINALNENTDYIYYIDSDMIFENNVGDEIFSDIVCVRHPGYMNTKGVPDQYKQSLAYIPEHIDFEYKQNAFFGGTKDCVLSMSKFLENQIDIDYKRGYIALWWDESHANKFYICYATKILSPEYCYNKEPSHACTKVKEYIPRIVIVPKNNRLIRSK